MAAATPQQREFGPHPLTIIREAIATAHVVGITVRIGSYGVTLLAGAQSSRWVRDPREDGVDPIGAAILARQPPVTDVDEAAAQAVNAPTPWVEGCAAGIARRERSIAWRSSIKARFYLAGYDAGTWLRSQLLHNVEAPVSGGKV